jgi:hypothetical protein
MDHVALDRGSIGLSGTEVLQVLIEVPAIGLDRVCRETAFHVQCEQVLLDALG